MTQQPTDSLPAESEQGAGGRSAVVPGTILIVDDEPLLIQTLKRNLGNHGYVVHTALSGLAGLEILKKHRIDLLITDLRMPGMDGLMLSERAREIQAHLQFFILTGHGDASHAEDAIKRGAAGYLVKPVRLKALRALVQRSLQKA